MNLLIDMAGKFLTIKNKEYLIVFSGNYDLNTTFHFRWL